MSQAVMEKSAAAPSGWMSLRLEPVIKLTDDQFFELCQLNRELRLERTAEGRMVVMPPTGWETGDRNSEINYQIRHWAKQDREGIVTDSSTGFKLPNGADRSPDSAWVRRERLAQLTAEQKRKFLPLCPDFVIELRSLSDSLDELREKMEEYIANGAQLGWLIDPEAQRVYVYRPNTEVEVLENPPEVSGDPELSGFVLDLREIWTPGI